MEIGEEIDKNFGLSDKDVFLIEVMVVFFDDFFCDAVFNFVIL